MMADVLRTVAQFSGNLKGVDVALVEQSANLTKVQQERLLDLLQKKLGIFLTYETKKKTMSKEVKDALEESGQTLESGEIERFYNKEMNFSISWYKDIKTLYNATMEK